MKALSKLLEAAVAAVPRPFKSTLIERVRKGASGFPKNATGPEILEALEARGTLPRGYGEYYMPSQSGSRFASPLSEVPVDMAVKLMETSPNSAHMAQLIGEHRSKWAQKEPRLSDLPSIPYRDQLIPHLEENWINPRIDVKGENLTRWLGKRANIDDPAAGFDMPTGFHPQHSGQQMIFQNPDDYFELLLNPRRGWTGQVPTSSATHWDPMSPLVHVRGQQVGPRHLVQEVQSDWDRTHRLFGRPKRFDPEGTIYPETRIDAQTGEPTLKYIVPSSDAMDYNHFSTYDEALNYYKTMHGNYLQNWKPDPDFPQLPPDVAKTWPEAGVKMALAYAARNPGIQRVSFVDDLIASAVRGNTYNPSGLYSEKIPGFLSKYAKQHGGLFGQESLLDSVLTETFSPARSPDRILEAISKDAKLSTVTMTPEFRKFLLGQQPLPLKDERSQPVPDERLNQLYQMLNLEGY